MSHKKHEQDRLTVTKTVRFSPAEWKIIGKEIVRIRKERANSDGMTEGEFFRRQIFNFPDLL